MEQTMWDESAGRRNLREIALTLMDSSSDGRLIVDTSGRILYCNQSLLRYLGLRENQVLGQNVRRLLHEVKLFSVMERGEHSVDVVGLVPRWGRQAERAEANIHLVSRYAVRDDAGNVYAGVLCVKFRNALLDGTKKLYASHSDLDFFRDSDAEAGPIPAAVGRSENFLKAKNLAIRSGNNDFPVLITGETGTGKEVIADLVHRSSRRSDKPFIKINCAAIPAELMESELFGYEPGAFTGASRTGKKGKFELADGGTILLDEIGDMPLPMQAKLLRVLQENEIERVGGTKKLTINVRVISATHRNLREMIEKNEFREDLFFRLNVINIQLAPLRERKEDILILAEHFLEKLNSTYGSRVTLPPGAAEPLINYPWPGNIRELNNVIQNAYALSDGNELNLDNFCASYQYTKYPTGKQVGRPLKELVEQFEKEVITQAVKTHDQNLTAAAASLGIPRSSLYNKLKRYEIEP